MTAILDDHIAEIAVFDSRKYEVVDPTLDLNANYRWYKEIPPYENSLWVASWKLAGIFMGSLDVVAWVIPLDGLRYRWRIKYLTWYESEVIRGEDNAKNEVEKRLIK